MICKRKFNYYYSKSHVTQAGLPSIVLKCNLRHFMSRHIEKRKKRKPPLYVHRFAWPIIQNNHENRGGFALIMWQTNKKIQNAQLGKTIIFVVVGLHKYYDVSSNNYPTVDILSRVRALLK